MRPPSPPADPVAAPGCAFCAIVAGDAPAHLVVADADAVAFLAVPAAAPGHVLVVPRRHVVDLWDADPDTTASVARTCQTVAARLRERLGCEGLTLRQNTGAASGQRVFHLHVHLVPRWHGDGHVGWPMPPDQPPDPDEVLARLGQQGA